MPEDNPNTVQPSPENPESPKPTTITQEPNLNPAPNQADQADIVRRLIEKLKRKEEPTVE